MRTASFHQNVHLQYYIADEGMESTDIIEKSQLFENSTFKDLHDIRDCLSYKDYLAFNGKD